MLSRLAQVLENDSIFPRNAVPSSFETSDSRRVERAEDSHESVVVVESEAAL